LVFAGVSSDTNDNFVSIGYGPISCPGALTCLILASPAAPETVVTSRTTDGGKTWSEHQKPGIEQNVLETLGTPVGIIYQSIQATLDYRD
jgi:hypothetical protein